MVGYNNCHNIEFLNITEIKNDCFSIEATVSVRPIYKNTNRQDGFLSMAPISVFPDAQSFHLIINYDRAQKTIAVPTVTKAGLL